MYIKETQNFPVVKISYQLEDALSFEANIAAYEALLAHEKTFVFISEGPFPQQQASHEERKKVAAWVKQKRQTLTTFVKALIHVEPDEQIRLSAQKFANNFIKFSGYPMFVVANQAQAQQLIQAVLKI